MDYIWGLLSGSRSYLGHNLDPEIPLPFQSSKDRTTQHIAITFTSQNNYLSMRNLQKASFGNTVYPFLLPVLGCGKLFSCL